MSKQYFVKIHIFIQTREEEKKLSHSLSPFKEESMLKMAILGP
jgi:hypothetical protein